MHNRQSFSKYFGLDKSQYELDFVDVPINNGDVPLFIDPYSISKRNDHWSIECHNDIVDFFQDVIEQIRLHNAPQAKYMLSGLKEPNQTRLGLSKGSNPRGRGIGGEQSNWIYDALIESTAVKTGFIKDLEECELLIEGIGPDKVSDITTNIIRHKLIEYTQIQCELWDIKAQNVPSGNVWNGNTKKWENDYVNLPVCNDKSVILVPKAIARFYIELDHNEYYQHFVLNFLQTEHLNASSSLVRTLRDGTKRPPYKTDLKKEYPLTKSYLYRFSQEHPEILAAYKSSKRSQNNDATNENLTEVLQTKNINFQELINKFNLIKSGNATASIFHNHIIGVLTTIFYPSLVNPKKEMEIHEGRKRIDITFENASRYGFFHSLPTNKQVPSGYVFVECKNYSNDPTNPELDQLSGRFATNRGKFGLLICRTFKDKKLFIKRCKDTAQDGRGFIIGLDDADMILLLTWKEQNDNSSIDQYFESRYLELVM